MILSNENDKAIKLEVANNLTHVFNSLDESFIKEHILPTVERYLADSSKKVALTMLSSVFSSLHKLYSEDKDKNPFISSLHSIILNLFASDSIDSEEFQFLITLYRNMLKCLVGYRSLIHEKNFLSLITTFSTNFTIPIEMLIEDMHLYVQIYESKYDQLLVELLQNVTRHIDLEVVKKKFYDKATFCRLIRCLTQSNKNKYVFPNYFNLIEDYSVEHFVRSLEFIIDNEKLYDNREFFEVFFYSNLTKIFEVLNQREDYHLTSKFLISIKRYIFIIIVNNILGNFSLKSTIFFKQFIVTFYFTSKQEIIN